MSILDDETDILNHQIKLRIDEKLKPIQKKLKELEKENQILRRKIKTIELWN